MSTHTRKQVAALLKAKPHTLKELAQETHLTAEAVSYHLKGLQPRLRVSKRLSVDKRMKPVVTNQYEIVNHANP